MPTKDPEKLRAKKSRWYRKNRTRILTANSSSKARKIRSSHLYRKFGLTLEAWEKEFEAQGKRCAACGTFDSGSKYGWHTDHDHRTNQFRGILCRSCNIALGLVSDNIEHLRVLIAYLEKTCQRLKPSFSEEDSKTA
jgi:hypothetical protein